MCDTFVVLPNASIDGSVIFGKNSDREPNEPHYVEIIPAKDHGKNESLQTTYISIPQVTHTHRIVLCRPTWIWGAEMGINEHGVVIGNEAVFSKLTAGIAPGLIGMDYLRLGLERAENAIGALKVITNLLEEYGQSGNCGFSHPFYYHNSYLIADQHEAWKLETVGNQWAAKKINQFGSISNALSIGEEWDMASDQLVQFAIERNWYRKGEPFDFAKVYSDWLMTKFSDSKHRQACTSLEISRKKGQFGLRDAMNVLRTHHNDPEFRPDQALFGADVCMHAGAGPVRINQTTGSMVTKVSPTEKNLWVTGSSAPCISIFKPFSIEMEENPFGDKPQKTCDETSYWWRHELLHREAIKNYPEFAPMIKEAYRKAEDQFISFTKEAQSSQSKNDEVSIYKSFEIARDLMEELIEKISSQKIKDINPIYHKLAWNKFNQQAGIDHCSKRFKDRKKRLEQILQLK